jgi:transposase-like protein
MKFQRKYSDQQWADALRLCAEGRSIAAAAKQVGMHTESLRKRVKSEKSMAAGAAQRTVRAPARSVGSLAPAAARAHRALVLRLFGYMDLESRTLELSMKRKLHAFQKSGKAEPPSVPQPERARFSDLVDNINKVTEMASEPALAATGRRKSAAINPELTALSDELDADAFAAASKKDDLRRDIADKLETLVPKA